MTCTQMLERLLDADPDELSGRGGGNSDVATHLRECDRCRAVAAQVLADTRLLASAVKRGAVVGRIRPFLLVPVLAAAAVVAFVLLPDESTSPTPPISLRLPVVALTPVVVAPAIVAPKVVPLTVAPGGASPIATLPPSRREVLRPYPPATAVEARPLQVTASEVSYNHVAVTPPPGKRAAVMRTNDPAITVVWVY